MQDGALIELAKYGPVGISIATLILVGFIIREFMKHMSESSRRHQANYMRLDKSIKANTKATIQSANVTKELYQWLRDKNGKLWNHREVK